MVFMTTPAQHVDLDERLLSETLDLDEQPTESSHALSLAVWWGDTLLDALLARPGESITADKLSAEIELDADDAKIITNLGDEAIVYIPEGVPVGLRYADGTITHDLSFDEDCDAPSWAYHLAFGERVAFTVGSLSVVVQYVRADSEMGAGLPFDWTMVEVFSISALLHVSLVAAAIVTPVDQVSMQDGLRKNMHILARSVLTPKEPEPPPKVVLKKRDGGKHRDEAGRFGQKDQPKQDAMPSKPGSTRVDPDARERDRRVVADAGLLGILKQVGGVSALSSVLGPNGLGTGINEALGGITGARMGNAGGVGGMATRGAGPGGDGRTLGIGGISIGGNGRGRGGDDGVDVCLNCGKKKKHIVIERRRILLEGGLKNHEVRRVIERNHARFKWCYEKELSRDPNLSGKIAVYFTIAPNGRVAKASLRESSMGDDTVETCVVEKMESLQFPNPRGGGVVVVTYPFVFTST